MEVSPLTKRQELNILRSQMENEFSSFRPHYQELADYYKPRRLRLTLTDTNRGDKRNQKILDTTPTFSARTLQSGLMSGITSPARPWFRLSTPNQRMTEFGHVKNWLHDTSELMRTIFLESNLYNALPIAFADIGVFGTGAILMEEDFEEVVRFYPMALGSYRLANSYKLRVDTFYREFRKTVRQLVDEFGKDKKTGEIDWTRFSVHVKHLYLNGQTEAWIDVGHIIRPNKDFRPNQLESKYKRFESCYWELGSNSASAATGAATGTDGDTYLREAGYDFFPVLCPRWEVTGEDVYGTDCPGMIALPDNKQLQLGEKKALKAIDKMIDPPMKGPTSLRQTKASILPGDITFTDEREGQGGFKPIHEVQFRLEAMESKQAQVRNRIQRAFFEDLFLMLAASDRRQITAREVEERHEEKLLALGPVLEQLNQDLLDPLIANTFQIMLKQNLVPPPPEELQGQKIQVQYISIMAQAQKLVGISGMERFMTFMGTAVKMTGSLEIMDKVDSDQFIDEYADALGVPPKIIRSDEDVAQMRQGRQQQQQAQQQMEQVQQGAAAVKDLAGAKLEGDNALSRIMDQAKAGSLTNGVVN